MSDELEIGDIAEVTQKNGKVILLKISGKFKDPLGRTVYEGFLKDSFIPIQFSLEDGKLYLRKIRITGDKIP